MWSRCSGNMLKAAKKNGKQLMYLTDRTLLRKDYYIICDPNQDTYERERNATSIYMPRQFV